MLAFVTDGTPAVNLGIACLVSALRRNAPGEVWELWIVGPNTDQLLTEEFLSPTCGDMAFRYLVAEDRFEDKYFIQTGLSQLFELLDPDRVILCLDYDHVVLGAAYSADIISRNEIWVSSEIGPDTLRHCVMGVSPELIPSLLPRQHFGASLIIGRVKECRKLGREWKGAYEDILHLIKTRHRVEIALTLAAERARISISACPSQLQGNFAFPRQDCWLFHYGGESEDSERLKLKLSKMSAQFERQGPSAEEAVVLHDEITREVTALLS